MQKLPLCKKQCMFQKVRIVLQRIEWENFVWNHHPLCCLDKTFVHQYKSNFLGGSSLWCQQREPCLRGCSIMWGCVVIVILVSERALDGWSRMTVTTSPAMALENNSNRQMIIGIRRTGNRHWKCKLAAYTIIQRRLANYWWHPKCINNSCILRGWSFILLLPPKWKLMHCWNITFSWLQSRWTLCEPQPVRLIARVTYIEKHFNSEKTYHFNVEI